MIVSKPVLAQWLAHGLALGVGYLAARQGVHVTPTAAAEIAAGASLVAGPLAGVLVKAEPASADDLVGHVERLFSVVAESGSNPRSALSGSVRPSVSATVAQPSAPVPNPPAVS